MACRHSMSQRRCFFLSQYPLRSRIARLAGSCSFTVAHLSKRVTGCRATKFQNQTPASHYVKTLRHRNVPEITQSTTDQVSGGAYTILYVLILNKRCLLELADPFCHLHGRRRVVSFGHWACSSMA